LNTETRDVYIDISIKYLFVARAYKTNIYINSNIFYILDESEIKALFLVDSF